MRQQTRGGTGFERKMTQRERFLQEMDQSVPWQRLIDVVAPSYVKGEFGPPPSGLKRMLRVYGLGYGYKLAAPSLEETLYDIEAMRRFVGIDLGGEAAPDENTICKFRHLREDNDLGAVLFAETTAHSADQGVQVSGGMIVDATITDPPSSKKNQRGERGPQMHQTKKGKLLYFGIKGHFGVDSSTNLIHTVEVTATKTADRSPVAAPAAQNHTHDKGHRHSPLTAEQEAANRYKLSVHSKVEQPIGSIKRVFGFRYRGIAKNASRPFIAIALSHLFMVRRRLVPGMWCARRIHAGWKCNGRCH